MHERRAREFVPAKPLPSEGAGEDSGTPTTYEDIRGARDIPAEPWRQVATRPFTEPAVLQIIGGHVGVDFNLVATSFGKNICEPRCRFDTDRLPEELGHAGSNESSPSAICQA